jgi:hypothetical protein
MGKNQNDRLIWANGAEFIASSGYVKTLDYTNSGRYAGLFQGGITLTVLPATAEHAGPDPQAPALGSRIQFRMACLEGPEGGTFNFWESTGSAPAESLAPGRAGTNLWVLSENDGSSGLDPYGHIHGRRFTATQAGLYKIAFTAVETSTKGDGGVRFTPIRAVGCLVPGRGEYRGDRTGLRGRARACPVRREGRLHLALEASASPARRAIGHRPATRLSPATRSWKEPRRSARRAAVLPPQGHPRLAHGGKSPAEKSRRDGQRASARLGIRGCVPNNSNTAALMATTPVASVGSITGRNAPE